MIKLQGYTLQGMAKTRQ